MRFGRRDRETFIGGYDPEHEMPDPNRDPRDRWQSEAYRRNAYDSRVAYRWNPDRIEDRYRDSRGGSGADIQPRDRYESLGRPDYDYGYDRGGYGHDDDRGFDRNAYERRFDRPYDRPYDRGYDRPEERDLRTRRYLGDTPNRDNWSSGDFDRRWEYGPRREERDLPPDRGYEHGRTYGAYSNMRSWDRRPDGERYPSDWGWGQSGREWEHGREFDDRGRRRRW